MQSVIPLYFWQAQTTASHVETSLIEPQEEKVRPTYAPYAMKHLFESQFAKKCNKCTHLLTMYL